MGKPVKVRDAPGLIWKPMADGSWVARWQCRTDIRQREYPVKSVKLATYPAGTEPTKEQWDWLADTCVSLQQEMLVWARGGATAAPVAFDGTLGSLMACYRSDPDSRFQKIRYGSRNHYETLMRLIERDHGKLPITEIKARTLLRWQEEWSKGGKVASSHAKFAMLRSLLSFGATILENPICATLRVTMSNMKFDMGKPRSERLTAAQVIAIRAAAHAAGRHSIALGQAIQFECLFRQRDILGEWVPLKEPGISQIIHDGHKWLRGIRWDEIDNDLILTHVTSKRQKKISVDLKNAPMVLEEFARLTGTDQITRDLLPASGPIVVEEKAGRPWSEVWFRQNWRKLARSCGIPDTVRNMDSRAGGISEASDAGADLELIRHAATHSHISMTARYSRGAEEKIVQVQKLRAEHRKKGDGNT